MTKLRPPLSIEEAPVDGWHYRVVQRRSTRGDRLYRSLKMVRYENGKPVETDATLGFAAGEREAEPVTAIAALLVSVAKELRRSKVIDISEIDA